MMDFEVTAQDHIQKLKFYGKGLFYSYNYDLLIIQRDV